ncbi:hypothetical protein CALCODRAFT_289357 [Calocera cornea HHB12733]|uniref:Uncharacterized protein n=1 Tax=Calocera cornea HHB12733 TaxID=1353952 RepID=A0A165FWA7_9BASI|nr:hypothetical protein CALCODRAFT_289357 [Calocera cornea HHB12733]
MARDVAPGDIIGRAAGRVSRHSWRWANIPAPAPAHAIPGRQSPLRENIEMTNFTQSARLSIDANSIIQAVPGGSSVTESPIGVASRTSDVAERTCNLGTLKEMGNDVTPASLSRVVPQAFGIPNETGIYRLSPPVETVPELATTEPLYVQNNKVKSALGSTVNAVMFSSRLLHKVQRSKENIPLKRDTAEWRTTARELPKEPRRRDSLTPTVPAITVV